MPRHTAGIGPPIDPIEDDRYTNLTDGQQYAWLDDRWTIVTDADPDPDPPVDPPDPPTASSLFDILRDDMALAHQGKLDGVPDGYDWAAKPRTGMGLNTAGMTAATAWGEVYSSGNPAKNTTVQVSNLQLWILHADNTWRRAQHTKAAGPTGMDAGYFKSDFQGNVTAPTSPATMPDGTRTGEPNPQWNLHFFPQGRITLPAGFKAILSCFDARLITKAGTTDDRSKARFLAGAGGDYWRTLDNPWTGSGSNGDFAIARHRWVTPEWQTYTCHAGTINPANLPPIGATVTPDPDPPDDPPDPGDPPVPGTPWTMPSGTVRIMPVGDSVTWHQANDPTGWATMPARFAAAGLTVVTVGSETGRNGIKHQGIGGWCLDDTNNACTHRPGTATAFHAGGVVQNIVKWCDTYKPHIIVLNAGANDTWTNRSAAQAVQALDVCLGLIRDHLPSAMVLVTIPRSWMDCPTLHEPDLGWALRGMEQVVTAKAASMHVRLFNQHAGFGGQTSGDWRDYIHISEAGTAKMMTATFNAVMALRT